MSNKRHEQLLMLMKKKDWMDHINISDLMEEFDDDCSYPTQKQIKDNKKINSDNKFLSKKRFSNKNVTSSYEDSRIYKIRTRCKKIKRSIFSNADVKKYPDKEELLILYEIMKTASEIAMTRIQYNIHPNDSIEYDIEKYSKKWSKHYCSPDCAPLNILHATKRRNKTDYRNNYELIKRKYSSTLDVYMCNHFKVHVCSEEKCVDYIIDTNGRKVGAKRCKITGITREFVSHFNENLKFTYYDLDSKCEDDSASLRSMNNNFFLMDLISFMEKYHRSIMDGDIITSSNRLSSVIKKKRRKKKATTTMRKSSSNRSKKSKRLKRWRMKTIDVTKYNSTDKLKFNGTTKDGKMKMRLRSFDYIMKNVTRIVSTMKLDIRHDPKFLPMMFLVKAPYSDVLKTNHSYIKHMNMISGKDTIVDKIINECVRVCKDLCPGEKRIKIMSVVAFERIKSQMKKAERFVESCIKSKKPIDSSKLNSIVGYNPLDCPQIMTEVLPEWGLMDVIKTVLHLRKLCIKSPYMKLSKSPAINVTNHIIATMYLMVTGLRIKGKDIVYPHILLSIPGYLVDERDLNKYGYSRNDVTNGLKSIKAGLNYLSKVQPLS